jgi:hypothetical protein
MTNLQRIQESLPRFGFASTRRCVTVCRRIETYVEEVLPRFRFLMKTRSKF